MIRLFKREIENEKVGSMHQIGLRRTSKLLGILLLSGLVGGIARAQAPATSPGGAPPAATKPAPPSLQTPEPPDTVVLKVSDQQFTKAELDFLFANLNPQAQRAMATQGRKQLGDQFALVIMLSQQAHSHHLDQTPEFQRRAAVQRQQLEAQAAYDEIVKQAMVSPEDVNQYYATHPTEFDEISVRQFVIRTRAANSPTGPGLPIDDAKARAQAIHKEVVAGTDIKKVMEDFKAPGDVIIEADPRNVRRGGMRPDMEKIAFTLKDGEVSEIVDAPQAEVFFQVTGHRHVELKEVSTQIEETLKKEKIDAAMTDLKKKTTIWMDSQYFAAPPAPSAPTAPPAPKLTTVPTEPTGKPPDKP
jgi:parvulin-like peptidyl-prolyl isomerase